MARGTLASLTIDLAANIGRFERGLLRAEQLAERRTAAIRRTFVRLGASVAAAFSARELTSFVGEAVKFADQLQNTADKLGLSVEALQEFRLAAQLTGVPVTALDVGLQRFTRRVGEAAQGSGVLKDVFTDLGIELRNSNGTLRSTEAILGDYADAVQNAGSSQEQLLLAFKAFDTEGAALVNTLRNGRRGLDDLRNSARDTGGILSSTLTETASTINDRWTILVDTIGNKFKAAALAAADSALNLFGIFNNLADVQGRLIEIQNELLEAEIQLGSARGRNARGAEQRIDRLRVEQVELQALQDQLIQARQARENLAAIGAGGDLPGGQAPGFITGQTRSAIDDELEYIEGVLQQADQAHQAYILGKQRREEQFALAQSSLNSSVANNTLALLSTLGRKSKGFALAALAVQKGLAIAEAIMATNVAVMKAFEYYGPTPAGYAAAGTMKTLGAINVGLIAATGLAQAGQINAGAGGGAAGLGTPSNPVTTTETPLPFETGSTGTRGTITINVNGVVTEEVLQDLVIPAIQDATNDKDVILFRNDSRQALELT